MKKIILALFSMCYFTCVASQIMWDCLKMYDVDVNGYHLYIDGASSSASISVYVNHFSGTGSILTAEKWNYLENCNAWLVVEAGTWVNYDLIMKTDQTFFHMNNIYNCGESQFDYDIFIKEGETAYLAFAHAAYKNPTDVKFGWAEIGVDENGTLYALHSMTDMSGNPVQVGVIPEPNTSLLLLIGFAGFALRRQK